MFPTGYDAPSYFTRSYWPGGVTAPSPSVFGAARGPSDRGILRLIRDALEATGAFTAVVTTGPPEQRGQGADRARLACLELSDWDEDIQANDASDAPRLHAATFRLLLIARMNDPDERDDAADAMYRKARGTVDGQSIGGWTYPWLTKLGRGIWMPATSAERRIVCTGSFAYGVRD